MNYILVFIMIILLLALLFVKTNVQSKQETFEGNHTPVVLHAFDQYYVSVKSFKALKDEIPALSEYFTEVFLPPLTQSTGIFLPEQLDSFDSNWGTVENLENLLVKMKGFGMKSTALVVTQHRKGNGKKWFKYLNPNYIGETEDDEIELNDYYKYMTTVVYNPWGLPDKVPDKYFIDGLPPDYKENGLENCYTYKDGVWSLYTDCRNKVPMYNTPGLANDSWLQSVNYCNANVLPDIIGYIKLLKSKGIDGIVIDQADAIDSSIIALHLNSDESKTEKIVNNIVKICDEAKAPEVDKDVKYTFTEDIKSVDVKDLTSFKFERKMIQNFYGELYGVTDGEKGWRGLLEMPDLVNSYLSKDDYCGTFDYGLKFVLNRMMNTKDLSIDGREFLKEKMIIGYPKYRSKTVTMVENHDTGYLTTLIGTISKEDVRGTPGNEVNFYGLLPAYFIIMFLPGTPMVYKLHYDVFKFIGVNEFIKARNECCIDVDSDFEVKKSEVNDVAWVVSNLNLSLKPKSKNTKKRLIKQFPVESTKVFVEINEKEPGDKVLYSRKLYEKNLWLKISFI